MKSQTCLEPFPVWEETITVLLHLPPVLGFQMNGNKPNRLTEDLIDWPTNNCTHLVLRDQLALDATAIKAPESPQRDIMVGQNC